MNTTMHANVRGNQRAISPMLVDLLRQFGKCESIGAGVSKLFFDKKARKQVATYAGPMSSLLAQHLDVYAVVGRDMQIITVGHRLERIRRQ